jgi:hypothetical protein
MVGTTSVFSKPLRRRQEVPCVTSNFIFGLNKFNFNIGGFPAQNQFKQPINASKWQKFDKQRIILALPLPKVCNGFYLFY